MWKCQSNAEVSGSLHVISIQLKKKMKGFLRPDTLVVFASLRMLAEILCNLVTLLVS